MTRRIADTTIVVAAPGQISSDLNGEAVIMNVKNGMYYGLNTIGARIWALLQQPRAVADLQEAILAEYNVAPDRCSQDIEALLLALRDAELIEIVGAASA